MLVWSVRSLLSFALAHCHPHSLSSIAASHITALVVS